MYTHFGVRHKKIPAGGRGLDVERVLVYFARSIFIVFVKPGVSMR